MKSTRALVRTGWAAAWLLLVIGGVRWVETGLTAWDRQSQALVRSRELLSRCGGWVAVEPEMTAARDRVMGPFVKVRERDLSWAALERFQQAGQELGMSVEELRPVRLPARSGEPSSFRLDAKVKGDSAAVSAFLRRLPDEIPGVRLEQLQVTPAEGGKLQLLVRLFFKGSA